MRRLKFHGGSRFSPARQRVGFREPSGFLERPSAEEENRLSVCFTGHRYILAADIPAVIERLDELLRRCYAQGYRDFLCGGALGFDTLAGERVAALASVCPDVRLIMVLPCGDQARKWPDAAISRYERLLYVADDIRVLAPAYYEGCMQARNRYLVDYSALCVCYLRHHKGGTASTVAYALSREMPVLNVAMADVCDRLPSHR